EGCCTLSATGETLIMTTADRRSFVRSPVMEAELPPGDPAEFGDLVARLPAGITVEFPVISADGLTLYYFVRDPAAVPGNTRPVRCPHGSLRGDVHSPFPAGQRLLGAPSRYEYVTGVSSDGLTLFMKFEWETRVLVRPNTTEPFGWPSPGVFAA